jgi:hypothetical protein
MMENRRFGYGSATGKSLLCALVVMCALVSAGPLATRTTAAQSDLRIAYPGPGMTLPGPDVPVVVSGVPAGEDTEYQVSLDGVVVDTTSSSSLVLNDVETGDHQLAIQELDEDGMPRPEVSESSVLITVLPAATATIHQGICDGFNPEPVEELGIVSLVEPLLAQDGLPSADRPVGVPLAVPVASTEAMLETPFNTFVDRAHVVTISLESPESPDGVIVVCGEIGGMLENGAVRFGLGSRGEAESFGVGTLIEEGDQTRVIIELVQSAAAPLALTRESVLPDGAGPLPVAIRQGVCAGLAREASFELEPLGAGSEGEGSGDDPWRGVALAAPVISSEMVIDENLDDLLIRAHAIGIRASGMDGIEDGTWIACGELGGPAFGSKLRAGLLAANLSGYVGVATLTESEGEIEVLIELVRGSSRATESESEPEQEQATVPAATVADPTAGEPGSEEVVPEEPVAEPPPAEPDVPVEPEVPVEPPIEPTPVPDVPTEVPTVIPTEVPPTEVPATEVPTTEPPPTTQVLPTDTPSGEVPTIAVVATDTPINHDISETPVPQS